MTSNQGKQYQNRVIVLPFEETEYHDVISDAKLFRIKVDNLLNNYPNLFPQGMEKGFLMKDIYYSEKLDLKIRRIKVDKIAYTIRPSFVLPRLVGRTKEAESPMFLRKFNVPFWALAETFGHSAMHWYRLEQSLGRHSLVETTVQIEDKLPDNLVADEKHTWLKSAKVYIATICGKGCILGASVAKTADQVALTEAYGVFKSEAQTLKANYQPQTINTDAWSATRLALKKLFPNVTLILCWLHVYINLRDRSQYKLGIIFRTVAEKLWYCYRAVTRASFSQRLRYLLEWAHNSPDLPKFMLDKLDKLYKNADDFRNAYSFPLAHRTSNMVDRLMQRMERHLVSMQYFHGSRNSAELSVRGWALIYNFAPFNPYTIKQKDGWRSPAEVLNEFRYHDSWLQNLLISTSLVGKYRAPQKAL